MQEGLWKRYLRLLVRKVYIQSRSPKVAWELGKTPGTMIAVLYS
jgi:hypothetical protein